MYLKVGMYILGTDLNKYLAKYHTLPTYMIPLYWLVFVGM